LSARDPHAAQTRANVNVPTHLWEQFDAVAKAHYRSRSDHLRYLMAEAVKAHDEANRGILALSDQPVRKPRRARKVQRDRSTY
jgi:hypothetical protein